MFLFTHIPTKTKNKVQLLTSPALLLGTTNSERKRGNDGEGETDGEPETLRERERETLRERLMESLRH